MKAIFEGEMMLLGWTESHRGGARVTFQLPDPEDLESFKGLTVAQGKHSGQRLAAVLVLIGDDEQPKDPPTAQEIERHKTASQRAYLLCKSPDFWAYLNDQVVFSATNTVTDEATCKEFLCRFLKINSRGDLDHDSVARTEFEALIEIHYGEWLLDHRKAVI